MFNFIKKYFTIIFIIIFVVIFWFSIKDDYIKNYNKKINSIEKEKILKQKIQSFSLTNLKKLENTQIFYTPYKELLNKIINKINNSQKQVYIEAYMLTEKRIKQSLIKAKKRWVDVKVILEKNPYKANNINNKHFDFLKKNNIDIVWSNPENYNLNHSKLIIFDNEFLISTWNFTYSTFAFNRDFFILSADKIIKEKLEKIFLNDFYWEKSFVYDDNLVISPEYSRIKFKKLFLSAKKSLNLYFQYLEDKELENILIKKAKENISIKIIVSKDFFEKNKEKIKFFQKNNIKIKALENPKMHSKAILVDNKYLFIWSENFSYYSLNQNREIWLIMTNKNIIQKFQQIFNKDYLNN